MRSMLVILTTCVLLLLNSGCALPPAPADQQALNLPIYKPLVNGRLVTVTIVPVNGAQLPPKCAERAAAWVDRYVGGDVRLLHDEPLTLSADENGAISQRQLSQHQMTLKDKGISDITVYVVPLFNDFNKRGFATYFPGAPGHFVGLHQSGIEASKKILSSADMHELVLKHELAHALGVPSNASHNADGWHCTHPECLLYWGADARSILTGLMRLGPPKDLCSVCRAEILAAQADTPLVEPDAPFDPLAIPDAVVAMNPENPIAYGLRAGFHREAGNLDAAIADASRAIELDPSVGGRYAFRGQLLSAAGRIDAAANDYAKCLELYPDCWPALNNLAAILLSKAEQFADEDGQATKPATQDIERAVELARQACEVTKWQKPRPMKNLARAYRLAGRLAEAEKTEQRLRDLPRQ